MHSKAADTDNEAFQYCAPGADTPRTFIPRQRWRNHSCSLRLSQALQRSPASYCNFHTRNLPYRPFLLQISSIFQRLQLRQKNTMKKGRRSIVSHRNGFLVSAVAQTIVSRREAAKPFSVSELCCGSPKKSARIVWPIRVLGCCRFSWKSPPYISLLPGQKRHITRFPNHPVCLIPRCAASRRLEEGAIYDRAPLSIPRVFTNRAGKACN